MMLRGSKLAPPRGVTSWNNRNKEGRIHFMGKMTRVRNPGPSWPSCLCLWLYVMKFFCAAWHGLKGFCYLKLPACKRINQHSPWVCQLFDKLLVWIHEYVIYINLFPNNKLLTLPNREKKQTAMLNLIKMAESGRKHWLKGRNSHYEHEQFLHFLQCFQKTCSVHMWKQGLLWEGVKPLLPEHGLFKADLFWQLNPTMMTKICRDFQCWIRMPIVYRI